MSNALNCQFYCLSFNNEKKLSNMEKRFAELDIACKFYSGVKNDDIRLNKATSKFNKRNWAITYSHLDIIYDFYYNNRSKYAVICEDDILIHKNFKHILKNILIDVNILNLDFLLLGYLMPYKLSNLYKMYPLKCLMPPDSYFKYHEYPEYLSGTHMYMITRDYAKHTLNKYCKHYAGIHDNSFLIDKILLQEGNRAILYPMLAIEDDNQEDEYHTLCHKIHYTESYI